MLWQSFKKRMSSDMFHHPVMKFFHIGDRINQALCETLNRYDTHQVMTAIQEGKNSQNTHASLSIVATCIVLDINNIKQHKQDTGQLQQGNCRYQTLPALCTPITTFPAN